MAALKYPTRARLKRFRFQFIVVLAAILVSEISFRAGVLGTAEHIYSDLWHRVSGVRYEAHHAALVVVDDRSLAEHGDDPMVFWTPLFARAAATLRDVGASVVGIDFLFAITPEDWISRRNLAGTEGLRDYDLAFRQELNNGKVVLVGAVARGTPAKRTACCLRIPITCSRCPIPISCPASDSPI